VAQKGPFARGRALEVFAYGFVHFGGGNSRARRRCFAVGSTRFDPFLDRQDIVLARAEFLFGRRHRVIGIAHAAEHTRFRGLAGHDLPPVDKLAQVANIIEAALIGAVLAVTTRAVGLQHGAGLVGEVARRVVAACFRRAWRARRERCPEYDADPAARHDAHTASAENGRWTRANSRENYPPAQNPMHAGKRMSRLGLLYSRKFMRMTR